MNFTPLNKAKRSRSSLLFGLVLVISFGSALFFTLRGFAFFNLNAQTLSTNDWETYINDKFHYTIQYPRGSELRKNQAIDQSSVQIFIIEPGGLVGDTTDAHIIEGMKVEIVVLPNPQNKPLEQLETLKLDKDIKTESREVIEVGKRQATKIITPNLLGKNFGEIISVAVPTQDYIYLFNAYPSGKNQNQYISVFDAMLSGVEFLK